MMDLKQYSNIKRKMLQERQVELISELKKAGVLEQFLEIMEIKQSSEKAFGKLLKARRLAREMDSEVYKPN